MAVLSATTMAVACAVLTVLLSSSVLLTDAVYTITDDAYTTGSDSVHLKVSPLPSTLSPAVPTMHLPAVKILLARAFWRDIGIGLQGDLAFQDLQLWIQPGNCSK